MYRNLPNNKGNQTFINRNAVRAGSSDNNDKRGHLDFNELVKYHNLAVDGDKEAVKIAYDLAQKIYEANPNDHLAEAYVGSTTSLLGRDAVEPGERIKIAVKGVKILDSAVYNDPKNIDIRVLRAYVCFRLPEMFFHRTSTAIEDFKYLASSYEEGNKAISQDLYWKVLYDMGTAYKNVFKYKESEKVWGKLQSISTDPKYRNLVSNNDNKPEINEKPAFKQDPDKKKSR